MTNIIDLVNKRTKIEKWAAEYLEKNSELMDDVDSSHPVYKPYLQKMAEYQIIMDSIRGLEYAKNK